MGKLSKGITFSVNDYVTAAKLYALIDTAVAASDAFSGTPSLYDIVMGDLTSMRAIHVANSPSSPATNDLMIGSDGFFDRWDGSAWVDLTNDFLFLLNNNASFTLVTGTPVVVDVASPSGCKQYPGPGVCFEPTGVSMGVYGPGVTAQIQVKGVALVRCNSPGVVGLDNHLRIPAAGATQLSATSSVLSDVLGIVVGGDSNSIISGVFQAVLTH